MDLCIDDRTERRDRHTATGGEMVDAWLRGMLGRKYDRVLHEDLPPELHTLLDVALHR